MSSGDNVEITRFEKRKLAFMQVTHYHDLLYIKNLQNNHKGAEDRIGHEIKTQNVKKEN